MPENEEAWELWQCIADQWRGAGMGVIGLDFGWVYKMAGIMRIPFTPAIYTKIKVLGNATLKRMRPKDAP